ncbi:6310_t:CDS:2 [Acaulospora morrowiae]|uniref:6310_t:CDS:1 n=1 Tax=Acaulospora morrowiae TaxID=94023 RepID=A0A9N9FPV8_9GLOM|nr:6310_t:CDS:2 [Acaulospora morrowiae]
MNSNRSAEFPSGSRLRACLLCSLIKYDGDLQASPIMDSVFQKSEYVSFINISLNSELNIYNITYAPGPMEDNLLPGVYAVKVHGELPDWARELAEDEGIQVISND